MVEKQGSKKDPRRGPFSLVKNRLIEFRNGFVDGTLLEDLIAVRHADQEGGGTQAVHLSRDALGEIVNAVEGIVGKEIGGLVTGEGNLVADVGHRLGQIQGRELEGGGQALVKCLMGSQAQDAPEFGLANEEQRTEGLAVHMGGE